DPRRRGTPAVSRRPRGPRGTAREAGPLPRRSARPGLGRGGPAHHYPAERRGERTLAGKARGLELGAVGPLFRRVPAQVRAGPGQAPLRAQALARRPGRAPSLLEVLEAREGLAGDAGATRAAASRLRRAGLRVHPGAAQAQAAWTARHRLRHGRPLGGSNGFAPGGGSPRQPDPDLRERPVVVGHPRHDGGQRALPGYRRRARPRIPADALRRRRLLLLYRRHSLRAGGVGYPSQPRSGEKRRRLAQPARTRRPALHTGAGRQVL
ncbi:MAG: hypothetical protein AVDCRST_MAG55-2095, partial [uncultured Rubrobacteraceae bacterium]